MSDIQYGFENNKTRDGRWNALYCEKEGADDSWGWVKPTDPDPTEPHKPASEWINSQLAERNLPPGPQWG